MRNNGVLSGCLVDSDADALHRAKLRRRKSLAISLAVEALVLAAILINPLFTPGTISGHYNMVPLPPIGGGGGHRAPHTQVHPTIHDHDPDFPVPIFHFPVRFHSAPAADADPGEYPSIGDGPYGGGEPGPGNGPGIFGGPGTAPPPLEQPRPPASSKPIFRSGGAQEAMLIRRVEPVYPFIAIQTRLSGTVELRAIIAKDGSRDES